VNYVPYGDVYFNSWYRDYGVTGGLFLQKATHDFDYLSYCLRSPIVRVAAMKSCGRVYRDASLRDDEGGDDLAYYESIGTPDTGMNEDSSSALLEFENGAQGVYTQVFYTRGGAAARGATFSGYQGTLNFDWVQNRAKVVHHYKPFEDSIKVAGDMHHHGGDGVLAENFIKVVRGEARPIANIWAGLQSVYACLAAKESADRGTFCDVRSLGGVSRRESTTP
ncbi:MAG: Gfo/Idh/MocA family oxidoreductase, partial [Puniceicoccales bacterium]